MTTTAGTNELVAQAQAATTQEQLDAIAAQSADPAVAAAVQARRDQLAPEQAAARTGTGTLGPNAVTEPTKRQYFEIPNGDGTLRSVNAFGEEKGSAEDKKRSDKASSAP